MSREREQQAMSVLRGIWSAREQDATDLDQIVDRGRTCKNLADVGFGGLVEGAEQDVRAAWRARLAREGKLGPSTVRDLVDDVSEAQR